MKYKVCEYCGAHLDPGEHCDCRKEGVVANTETLFEKLKREARYAQRSFSTELLYQTYGKAQMARELDALTHEEFTEINHMTVYFMNTDHEYIWHKNKEFNACDVAI